ncbi:MAG: response regulator, partial [Candidatus Electrothrix sp. AUS4]|nr:response regulator [Candidatus Electrothrix sp. AUS4]
QAALEKKTIFISQIPDNYIQVSSALGGSKPNHIVVFPFVYNDNVKAVLELGTFGELAELQVSFLENVGEKLAIAINGAQARSQLQEALAITTGQTEVLQSQQDELKAANEELEEQAQRLRASEEELQANQDQLMATNEQLEEKNRSLNRQKEKIELANKELKLSRMEIEQKAEEVARASKYKSEFLANMSHELRTPLNSLLLLAQTLKKNRKGNLTEDDIESVRIIQKSGNDLLYLINDILDLSKIESGQMVLVQDNIVLADLLTELQNTFLHLAEEKGLALHLSRAKDVPEIIRSDEKRVGQILKNLLSNALKFTEHGTVSVSVSLCSVPLGHPETIAIAVQDSGIGIPEKKQKIVFEAFQQADGSTARKYGGTGLGLSISRELASLLGGEICMESQEGEGTTFTLYLPCTMPAMPDQDIPAKHRVYPEIQTLCQAPIPAKLPEKSPGEQESKIADDRENILEKDKVVLVIEDDTRFAALLVRQCREKGLKCIATSSGEEGLVLAERYLPIAIILDLQLPGLSGWEVLESLKNRIELRHIPVHIISAAEVGERALRSKGAVDALQKPVCQEQLELALLNIRKNSQQHIRKLLVADQDAEQRKAVISLIGNNDVQSEEAASGQEVSVSLKKHRYDCLVMGLDFLDLPVLALLHQLKKDQVILPPIIIYTDRKLSREENAEIRQYASSVIIKGAMSEERLLDESSLFLHRMVS